MDTYKLGKIAWRLRLWRCSLPGASARRGLSVAGVSAAAAVVYLRAALPLLKAASGRPVQWHAATARVDGGACACSLLHDDESGDGSAASVDLGGMDFAEQ